VRFFHSLTETENLLRASAHPRYQLEIGLVKLMEMRRLASIGKLVERIASLEEALRSGKQPTASTGNNSSPPAASGGAPPEAAGGKVRTGSGTLAQRFDSKDSVAAPPDIKPLKDHTLAEPPAAVAGKQIAPPPLPQITMPAPALTLVPPSLPSDSRAVNGDSDFDTAAVASSSVSAPEQFPARRSKRRMLRQRSASRAQRYSRALCAPSRRKSLPKRSRLWTIW
jgi:hypothetical protein